MFTRRRCIECGEGTIDLLAKEGRRWPYKDAVLPLPADFAIPTCSHCGSEWIGPEQADALDEVLERAYLAQLPDLSQRIVVSQEAFNRLMDRVDNPRPPSQALIDLFKKKPDATD